MHGKSPTVKQKKQLNYLGLNYKNYLILQDTPNFMRIKHRISDVEQIIPKRIFEGMK